MLGNDEIFSSISSNVASAMCCVQKGCSFIDCKNPQKQTAMAFINKSLYHISIAKSLYISNYTEFMNNDMEDFFETYEKFIDIFFTEYEQIKEHNWNLNLIEDLEKSYKYLGFPEI